MKDMATPSSSTISKIPSLWTLLVLSVGLSIVLSLILHQLFPQWMWQSERVHSLVDGLGATTFLILGVGLYFHGHTLQRP